MILSPGATLADVISSLNRPEEYVRCVLGNMHACKKDGADDVAVTIGITGEGKVPFYRIDFVADIQLNGTAYGLPGSFPMYNGRSHKRMEEVTREVMRDNHWSTRSMTYEEVQGLLGELRSVRRI